MDRPNGIVAANPMQNIDGAAIAQLATQEKKRRPANRTAH